MINIRFFIFMVCFAPLSLWAQASSVNVTALREEISLLRAQQQKTNQMIHALQNQERQFFQQQTLGFANPEQAVVKDGRIQEENQTLITQRAEVKVSAENLIAQYNRVIRSLHNAYEQESNESVKQRVAATILSLTQSRNDVSTKLARFRPQVTVESIEELMPVQDDSHRALQEKADLTNDLVNRFQAQLTNLDESIEAEKARITLQKNMRSNEKRRSLFDEESIRTKTVRTTTSITKIHSQESSIDSSGRDTPPVKNPLPESHATGGTGEFTDDTTVNLGNLDPTEVNADGDSNSPETAVPSSSLTTTSTSKTVEISVNAAAMQGTSSQEHTQTGLGTMTILLQQKQKTLEALQKLRQVRKLIDAQQTSE